jgi:hypothetical protein
MERIVPYLLCVIFLAVMYGLMRLALLVNEFIARRSVYQSGVYTAKTVHTLLLAQFGERHICSERCFPYTKNGENGYEKCDHILFLNGALAIVTVCREDGVINNLSFGETWYSRIRTKTGAEKEHIFENPITAGERKKQALLRILENSRLRFQIPVRHIVIFPSRRVRFSLPRQEEIMSPPEALRRLTEMNKTVRLTKEQKKAVIKAVKHASLTESQAEKRQTAKQTKTAKPIPTKHTKKIPAPKAKPLQQTKRTAPEPKRAPAPAVKQIKPAKPTPTAQKPTPVRSAQRTSPSQAVRPASTRAIPPSRPQNTRQNLPSATKISTQQKSTPRHR